MVKTVDIRAHQVLVVQGVHPQNMVQYNPQMEGILKSLLRKVLTPFGQWKERRLAAQEGVAMVTESVRDGMKMLMRQMQLYKQICGQEDGDGISLAVGVERMDEWWQQIQEWAREMND